VNFVAVGLNHRTAAVALRERFAYGERELAPALARLRAAGLADEAVLVSTCNRVELYAATPLPMPGAADALANFLHADRQVARADSGALFLHPQQAGVEHLFRVAAGLDSLALGETEILGQLKQAYAAALAAGHTGRLLNQAFQTAFGVAKRIRTETGIQRGQTSVASVAVELAESILGPLSQRDVMVIGAGDTSEKTARALLSRGARSLIVSNRSFDRAAALAAELGGKAIRFDAWEQEFAGVDVVISSTRAPHYVLDPIRLGRLQRHRAPRPLLLIDLAVPRDIDPAVRALPDVFLADMDDLRTTADGHLQARREELVRCETIIRERAAQLLARLAESWPPGTSRPQPN
jgi:glutamyl-tRNA reductase